MDLNINIPCEQGFVPVEKNRGVLRDFIVKMHKLGDFSVFHNVYISVFP